MDFHSLTRRDLQSLCKMNKIPANKTNIAMADALAALEIVEGIEEYINQSDSNVVQSPTSVARLPPNTATRRKTTIKTERQSSSLLVNRSCRLASKKSLDGEMDQENVAQEAKTNDVKFEANVVAKTPAARSTRKATAEPSRRSKVQESKKGELVQSAYSTRRSTRLLAKCMADLSLKTKENLDKAEKIEESELKVSAQEKNSTGSEERIENTEVVPGKDLSASMEKEWEMLKHDSDQVTGDLGDNAVSDANTETNKDEGDEVMSDEKESKNGLVQVNKQEEILLADKAISEEGSEKKDNNQETGDTEIYVDLVDDTVLEHANTETNNDNKELKNVQAFDIFVQVEHQETEVAVEDNVFETEKTNTFDEAVLDRTDGVSEAEPEEDNSGVDADDTISEADSNQTDNQETEHAMVYQTDGDSETKPEEDTEIYVDLGDNSVLEHANSEIINDNKESKNAQAFDSLVVQVEHQETKEAIQKNDSGPEKANTFDEEAVVDRTDDDAETELDEDSSGVDSDGTISEADSNQADNQKTEHAIQKNDSETEKTNTFDEEAVVDLTDGASEDDSSFDSEGTISEAEQDEDDSSFDSDGTISEADSNETDSQETEQTNQENDPAETEKINTFDEGTVLVDHTDGDLVGDHSGVDLDVTISEADSNQAINGSDIAEEGSVTAPTSPPLPIKEAIVNRAPLSPFVAVSISAQFPRPNKSASKKNSAMKVDNDGTTNKENNMEMMMMMNVVNNIDNGDRKGETKKKKVEIDEENLKDVSMKRLVKMVKELSIKSSNNTAALQMLPAFTEESELRNANGLGRAKIENCIMVQGFLRYFPIDHDRTEQSSPPMKIQDVDEEEEERYSDTHDPYPLDPVPEWDVDSNEGLEYESDPDRREIFSDEESYEQYRIDHRRAFNSNGFIYEPMSGSYPIKDLEEIGYDNRTTREKMTNLANLCIKKLNETKGKTVEFVHIVRVFKRWEGVWKSYITFSARESPNGPLVEYQAKVVTFPGNCKPPIPILCRPSLY